MLDTKTLHRQICKGCASGPAEDLDRFWWLPGVVVVEFKQPVSPGTILGTTNAMSSNYRTGSSGLDLDKFRRIVDKHQLKAVKKTFQFDKEQVPSRPDYERFLTLYLNEATNIPALAKQLSAVGGVVRAAAEPILSPPIREIPYRKPKTLSSVMMDTRAAAAVVEEPLLNEPLAVSGGEALGVNFAVGTGEFDNQWYLFRSRVDGVISSGTNGAGVVVAVVDWGFKLNHIEFINKVQYTYNAAQDNTDVSSGPAKWHGTASLGLVGAGDNDEGMLGFAAGADLWAIQGQDSGDNLDNRCWARAIEKVRTKDSDGKRKVILIEASTTRGFNVESSITLREPIKAAIEDNCVVCVPAGNLGVNAARTPGNAAIPETGSILVGATQYRSDPVDIRRGISNWGPRVVVSAPGDPATDVTTCDCGIDSYRNEFGGTSGATAKVAGAMALVLQSFPEVTQQQIVEVLKTRMPQITTADKPMGAFLDVAELMTQVEEFLSEQ